MRIRTWSCLALFTLGLTVLPAGGCAKRGTEEPTQVVPRPTDTKLNSPYALPGRKP